MERLRQSLANRGYGWEVVNPPDVFGWQDPPDKEAVGFEVQKAERRLVTRLLLAAVALLLSAPAAWAQSAPVRYTEGSVHGFLVLRTLEGEVLADGDLIQSSSGDRVTTKLVFRFADGSFQEETTVYSQRKQFRLISDRLVQKGPAFPQPLTMTVDGRSGRVTANSADETAREGRHQRITVPPVDLANGLLPRC